MGTRMSALIPAVLAASAARGGERGVEPSCGYANLRVGEVAAASQKAVDVPFFPEAADDFILTDPGDPDGLNPCRLEHVTFAVFHQLGSSDPSLWDGLKITIYQEKSEVCSGQPLAPPCERNPDKGPGGYPVPTPVPDLRDHEPCCSQPGKAAIACELKVPISAVTWAAFDHPTLGVVYQVDASGLEPLDCLLAKNKKYWIAPAPVMPDRPFGQTFLLTSPDQSGHEAQLIFPEVGLISWTRLQTQFGAPDPDLYLAVWAVKAASCPWDCIGGDDEVGIDEFLAVLGAWGAAPGHPCDFDGDGMIGIEEFLKILGVWGPCP